MMRGSLKTRLIGPAVLATIVLGGLDSRTSAQVLIDMPAPKRLVSATHMGGQSVATAQADVGGVGALALNRYARARTGTSPTYSAPRQPPFPGYNYYGGPFFVGCFGTRFVHKSDADFIFFPFCGPAHHRVFIGPCP